MAHSQKTALIYDFDGTLAKGNIQEHTFIPHIDSNPKDFWGDVGARAQEQDSDQILIYMQKMIEDHDGPIERSDLRFHGKRTPLFDGVEEWFSQINQYAAERNLDLEHYIISSGIKEMIEGCSIADEFEQIFASHFVYKDDVAVWPGVSVNYTTKTQYLFRINKGIHNHWDNESINKWMPIDERPIPFSRMIYIGDGETDVPSMKMVRLQGGHSIAVFDPEKWDGNAIQESIHRLVAEDRVSFVAPADYKRQSQLDVTVKGILGKIAREEADYRE